MNLDEIITRISALRIRANLSARELSKRIGVNDSYINRLENAKTKFEPSLKVLLAIIETVGSTPEEFFYSNLENYKRDKEGISFFQTLSKAQKQAVMNLYNASDYLR